MADESGSAGAQGNRVQAQLRLERIYLKDASFESPGSPGIFSEQQWQPQMQVDINTKSNSLGDNRHEVVLGVTIKSSRDDDRVAFICEIQQAGIFVVEGVEGGALRQVLAIACPNALFPYLREAVDNLVLKGGFPPLQMAPVNFEVLYSQAVQQAAQKNTTQH